MSELTEALSNLVDGRPFILRDGGISRYPSNLDIKGDVPSREDVEAELARLNGIENERECVHRLRSAIAKRAGDAESLLGTTADGVQLLLYGFSDLIVKLHSAKSMDEVNAAAEPFHALAVSFLTKVENGDVLLPFTTKGIDNVVSDIESRATVVAEELGKER